jgi:hypothetical protein
MSLSVFRHTAADIDCKCMYRRTNKDRHLAVSRRSVNQVIISDVPIMAIMGNIQAPTLCWLFVEAGQNLPAVVARLLTEKHCP